jgi:hypothetical protein
MKVVVKDTGEVINVVSFHGAQEMWSADNGNLYHTLELEFPDSDMPTERRMRYELAKAAVQGLSSKQRELTIDIAIDAIIVADEVIKRLKKESEVNNG